MTKNQIPYIHATKGVASMIIMMHHYALWLTLPVFGTGTIEAITGFNARILMIMRDYGLYAVDLFFFLSGFLSYWGGVKRLSNMSLCQYMGKKIKKIYPLLFLNIVLSIIGSKYSLMHIARNLLLIHCGVFTDQSYKEQYLYEVGGATWFLGPLFLCYLVFYLITRYSNTDFKMVLYSLCAIFGMVSMQSVWNAPFVNYKIGRGLGGFFCGVLFCIIFQNIKDKLRAVPTILTAVFLLIWALKEGYSGITDCRYLMIMIIMPCYIVICNFSKTIQMILQIGVLERLGDLSMGIYLLHLPIRRWLVYYWNKWTDIGLNSYRFFITYLSVCLIFVITYNKFGKKYTDIIKWIFMKKKQEM